MESFLGVSRNWNFTEQGSRSGKRLVSAVIWTASSVSAMLLINAYLTFYDEENSEFAIRINTSLTTASAILAMIWGSATSKIFEELLYHLNETHLYLKPHSENVRNHLNLYTAVAMVLMLLLIVNSVGSIIVLIMQKKTGILDIPFHFYWINLIYLVCVIRSGFGYLLFYCILKVISVQFELIASNVKEIGRKFGRSSSDADEILGEYAESVDKMCTAYVHSSNSCRLANTIFSVPVTILTNYLLNRSRLRFNIIYRSVPFCRCQHPSAFSYYTTSSLPMD